MNPPTLAQLDQILDYASTPLLVLVGAGIVYATLCLIRLK